MAIDIQKMKQRLEAKRDELQRDISGLTEAYPAPQGAIELNEVPTDFEEQAVDVQEMDEERAVLLNDQSLLAQVNAALERIEQGTYGICSNCGQPIEEKRLEAIPWTTLCIKDAELLEKRDDTNA